MRNEGAPWAGRVLIVAAHPDDETIGCGGVLGRISDAHVAHLTDGAPRDQSLVPAAYRGDRAAYRLARREELSLSLGWVGLGQGRMFEAGIADQEASYALPWLIGWTVDLVERLRPDALVTHPYEGGHPDHDAAAFVARCACRAIARRGARAPELWEMTSYHERGGRLETGCFLNEPTKGPFVVVRLREDESTRKERMIRSFATQQEVLSSFSLGPEFFRRAPSYDFSRPPHSGRLYYETLGWPLTGAAFSALATRAHRELFGDEP